MSEQERIIELEKWIVEAKALLIELQEINVDAEENGFGAAWKIGKATDQKIDKLVKGE